MFHSILQSILAADTEKSAWFVNCTNQVTMERDIKTSVKDEMSQDANRQAPALCT
jgi:hypothetical protein